MSCSLTSGNLIRTFTGKELNPFELKPEDVVIEDIAHSLACLNRFCGHTSRPISVGQHSVYVARLCEGTRFEMKALLHDAAEAYFGEITRWIKRMPQFAAYREVEEAAQAMIWKKFGCTSDGMEEPIRVADRLMVRYEGLKGFGPEFKIDDPDYPDITVEESKKIGKWAPWNWRESEEIFLVHYRMYSKPVRRRKQA
jgi:hypothetical protein